MQNYIQSFQNSRYNNPLFLAAAGFGVIIIIVLIAFAIELYNRGQNPEGVYNDPLSGETVYNPKDRTPETFNTENQVTYLGFSELLDYGISFSNIQSLKDVIRNIPEDTDKVETIKEVSIDVKSLKHTVQADGHAYDFGMRINRTTDYEGQITIRNSDGFFIFTMKDKAGETVFDSYDSH